MVYPTRFAALAGLIEMGRERPFLYEWECILKSRQEVRNQTNPGKYLETRRVGRSALQIAGRKELAIVWIINRY